MVGQHQGEHRLGDGDKARQHRGIVTTVNLTRGRSARAVNRLLGLRDARRGFGRLAYDNLLAS